MADTYSFDIGSKIDFQEIDNAINQTNKEIMTRYDLKDSDSEIEVNEKESKLSINASDEFKLKGILEILKQKLTKRNISSKALTLGPIKTAGVGGSKAKIEIEIQNGIPKEKAKEIVKDIKATQFKVTTSIQEDQVRVSAKKIDDLQAIMAMLRDKDYGIFFQFLNYR